MRFFERKIKFNTYTTSQLFDDVLYPKNLQKEFSQNRE